MRRRWHSYFLCLCGAMLLAACGGPTAPQDSSLLSDADLDSAVQMQESQAPAPTVGSNSLSAAAVITRDETGAAGLFGNSAIDGAKANHNSRGYEDAGGYLAYVEKKGDNYSIRLVDLNEDNSPERRGDRVVYRGKRPIQSVAVSRDGQTVAFIAQTKSGDNDVFLLDPKRHRVISSRTPEVDESDVSMSLDGRAVAWQAGTPELPSFAWFHEELGGYVEVGPAFWQSVGLPVLTAEQPSLAGDGFQVVYVENTGNLGEFVGEATAPSIAIFSFVVDDGVFFAFSTVVQYQGLDLSDPSISYSGNQLLFQEVFGGTNFLSLIDIDAGTFTDLLVGSVVDHPYLTADGDHATFAFGGEAILADISQDTLSALSPSAKTEDSATYWARGNIVAYTGNNDQGTFVRPGQDLNEEGRTVGYHAYEFMPAVDDVYEILSTQFYDGYLNLYVGTFNPKRPERNLLAGNDDFGGGWDPEVGSVQSRIVAELERNKRYTVVTSACGAPGTPCGPSEGFFRNAISGGATLPPPPQPPTELPVPDNSRFNITLRFWNDTLGEAEQAIFQSAADRWAQVITGDIANIPNLVLSEQQTTAGAPGIVGELDDVIIDASKVAIDGPSGVLARAGAFYGRAAGTEDQYLPVYGIMEFDEAEFEPGGFFYENLDGFTETILHEMAHVLGISRSTWIPLGLIEGNPVDGSCSDVSDPIYNDPRYLGASGNDAWVNTYGATTATVPIANTNGCGTADSHWREIYLQDEIMTGFAAGGGEPISEVTIGAFQDLGYVVDMSQAEAWSIPPLPTLSQISPNPTTYDIAFDFTNAFTNSLFGDVTASVTAVDLQLGLGNTSTSGCEAADFAGFPAGNIALLQRGSCDFGVKALNALNAGASGVIMGNQGNTEDRMFPFTGTFGGTFIPIVAVPISYDLMVELSQTPGLVMRIDNDTSDNSVAIGPQALSTLSWQVAEELIDLRGAIDANGKFTYLGD